MLALLLFSLAALTTAEFHDTLLQRPRPTLDGVVIPGPLQVKLGIDIRKIHDFLINEEFITLETELVMMWTDKRVLGRFFTFILDKDNRTENVGRLLPGALFHLHLGQGQHYGEC